MGTAVVILQRLHAKIRAQKWNDEIARANVLAGIKICIDVLEKRIKEGDR